MATSYNYPRADAEVGGGKTKAINKLSFKVDNGAQFEATFGGGGVSFGPIKCDGSFDLKIPGNLSSNAPERKWLRNVFNKESVSATFKIPSFGRVVFTGAFSSMDINSAVEGAVEGNINFVGTAKLIEATL